MSKALWLSAATMASRVLGLARDQLFAALVGANAYSDAFVTAFRIPNLLRDLFAEGALSSAFVPTFADTRANRGEAEAWRLGNIVVGLVLVVVGALALAGMVFSRELVAVMAPGYPPAQAALAAKLARIMMPFLPLVSLAAVSMGMLNAQSRFTAPALAPALFNVGSIAVGLGLWAAGASPERAVVGWSAGTLLGGLLQLLAQTPSLRGAGFRLRPRLGRAELAHPGVRRIGRLMGAAVIGLSATQVNIIVNTIFASHQERAVTWLNFAFRLMQLPLGVFGVAIATVATAGLAQRAAARDLAGVRDTLGSAMRLVAFLNVPSAVGLMVLARPIISLIYQHGRFGPADTAGTAEALVFYACGLYAYSAVKVFAPAFYALDEARVPVLGSVLGMASNVALNLALFPVLGFRGVALGTSLSATVNFAVLAIAWRVRHGRLGGAGVYRQLLRVVGATAALALAAWATERALEGHLGGHGLGRQLVVALVPIGAGFGAYLVAAKLLGVTELTELAQAWRRRAARRRKSPAA
ncbi:MAG TPA: murein biosynthesis integral membrane protein MurJ [Anaeromyxobacteraceae bacterium]|jgi:putative peptidoglycan lipid II flippase|nr:murein biosynthesis integral membrane protein MurJ [Anaeromyxobacteraceae bacterium]